MRNNPIKKKLVDISAFTQGRWRFMEPSEHSYTHIGPDLHFIIRNDMDMGIAVADHLLREDPAGVVNRVDKLADQRVRVLRALGRSNNT